MKIKNDKSEILENIERAKKIIERDINKPSVIFVSPDIKIAYQQLIAIFGKSKYVKKKVNELLKNNISVDNDK